MVPMSWGGKSGLLGGGEIFCSLFNNCLKIPNFRRGGVGTCADGGEVGEGSLVGEDGLGFKNLHGFVGDWDSTF